ncbi:MAG: oligopeptide ABC transporter ATP-binding protein OppD [Alphaproteobacteria bacterium]|nr:oligopeptide ABC transporter ATP-binding protein OppD [Alphaproteobacteria bacterium]
MTPLLEITGLDIRFATPDGEVHAVKNVSLSIGSGECVGVVGESGSGKSQLFLGAFGLLAANGRASGSVRFRSREILGTSQKQLNAIRGGAVTMIFQDPLTALTPHMTVGRQIMEALILHRHVTRAEATQRTQEMLEHVRIPEAARRMKQYPHELSGGMRQRVMIAIAAITGPDLLIADEPTTALDVTVQAQILEILKALRAEQNTAIALVSHDMGVIASIADRVAVMRRGEIVEAGEARQIFHAPQHDYTKMLLAAVPRLDRDSGPRSNHGETLLAVEDIHVAFPIKSGLFEKTRKLKAVDGVSFTLRQGETLGVVGESGSGKSTLARAVLKLLPAGSGRVVWMGRDLNDADRREIRALRGDMQIVFQDPLASLDPRMPVGRSIAEPLKSLRPELSRDAANTQVKAMMAQVGLDPSWINRYPHELSGGQNQRVGIARAMIVSPRLVVCDEAVSALDVSIQAEIVGLIGALQRNSGLSLLFISHDLAVVRRLCHRVMVLYLGRVVEMADADALYNDPRHPYTRALLSAVLTPDPDIERSRKRVLLSGDVPSPLDPRAQLRFLPSRLSGGPDYYRPKLLEVAQGHFVAEYDEAQDTRSTL